MQAREFLVEAGALDAALRRGWVNIKYLKLNGKSRLLTATTNTKHFTYVYKRPERRMSPRRNILVWERGVGWRALRRNRILGWVEAGPIEPTA
jgi:hypothetical protein